MPATSSTTGYAADAGVGPQLSGSTPAGEASVPRDVLGAKNWTDKPSGPWMPWSPFSGMAWPEFRLPQLPKPEFSLPRPTLPRLPGKTEAEQARNTWLEQNADPAEPSPWQAVTNGARRVRQSSRNAWRKTVDLLTPGDDSPPIDGANVARREAEPSIWERMSGKKKEPEGPRTVTELLGQERLKY
jgi:hypothetical protein